MTSFSHAQSLTINIDVATLHLQFTIVPELQIVKAIDRQPKFQTAVESIAARLSCIKRRLHLRA